MSEPVIVAKKSARVVELEARIREMEQLAVERAGWEASFIRAEKMLEHVLDMGRVSEARGWVDLLKSIHHGRELDERLVRWAIKKWEAEITETRDRELVG